jgi:hypothetical protein
VTIDARVTAIIYTGDHEIALLFIPFLLIWPFRASPAHPAERRRP